jgi:hypothetical protein
MKHCMIFFELRYGSILCQVGNRHSRANALEGQGGLVLVFNVACARGFKTGRECSHDVCDR